MYDVSNDYRTALNAGQIQHIRGTITLTDGSTIALTEDNISNPSYTKQCTESTDTFMFGQLYTGTLEFTLISTTLRREKLRKGILTLEVSVGDLDEWVPLGVFNIDAPERSNNNAVLVKCLDNTSKLDVAIPYDDVGIIKMARRMEVITELTGVEFAQSLSEILELGDMLPGFAYGNRFCSTCRAEVSAIAQAIGCIVYADRQGRIFFRKVGSNGFGYIIPARRRFKADFSEYSFSVRGVSYTDKYGTTVFSEAGVTNTAQILNFADNPYLSAFEDDTKRDRLRKILRNIQEFGVGTHGAWIPGSIDYYGDPTIDLGDVIELEGGYNTGSNRSTFIVTADNWQFRGPQTLISAGAGNGSASASSSASSGSSSSGSNVYIQQATLSAVDIEFYRDSFTSLIEIGEVLIGAGEDTLGIVQITAVLVGNVTATNELRLLLDGVMQTVYTADMIAQGEKRTVTLSAVLGISGGKHILSVEAKGNAQIERITGVIYGQGIEEYRGIPTFESDYTYNSGAVQSYNGNETDPRIPAKLSGDVVETIGGGSFEGSDVEYAYIPDGVEEIQ